MNTINADFYRELLDNLSEGVYFVDRDRRITFWNKAAQALTGRAASEVLGFRCADNILAHIDEKGTQLCSKGCPLVGTMKDGHPRQITAYMLHKEGYRVPVSIKVNPIRDKNGNIVGGVESFSDNSDMLSTKKRIHELEQLALLDTLTSIGNRRYADITLEEKFSELKRYNWPFGIVICDIDNFKKVNDNYGHNVGDEMLKMVASTLALSIRNIDGLFRWGGEEFLAVMAGIEWNQLYNTAERMRHMVEASALPHNNSSLRVTISAGATKAEKNDGPLSLVQRADTLLYKSKAEGKNRCSIG